MEYNTDGMAPRRLWYFITYSNYKRTLGLLLFLLVAAAIPLTAWYAEKQTKIKQQAAGMENGAIYVADSNGNPLAQPLTDPNVYLKIVPPQGWRLPGQQGAIQKSSPIASFIKTAYAQTNCSDATFCERCLQLSGCGWRGTPGAPADPNTNVGCTSGPIYSCPAGYDQWYTTSCSLNQCSIFPSNTPIPTSAATSTPTPPAATPTATPTSTTPPPASQIILRQVVIKNDDGGSYGHVDASITLNENLNFIKNGYLLVPWTLNTNVPADPNQRVVKVDFYDDAANSRTTGPVSVAVKSPIIGFREQGDCIGTDINTNTLTFTCGRDGLPNKLNVSWNVSSEGVGLPCNIYIRGRNGDDVIDNGNCTGSKTITAVKNEPVTNNGNYELWISNGGSTTDTAHACLNMLAARTTLNCADNPPIPTLTIQPGVPSAAPTPTTTIVPGGSPTPTVTPSPTSIPSGTTPIASPTPTATLTPPPLGGTKVTITLTLSGIGPKILKNQQSAAWNTKPIHDTRDLTVYLYEPGEDTNNDPNGKRAKFKPIPRSATLEYNSSTGKFEAKDFDLGPEFTSGDYQILVITPGYLRKRIAGTKKIATGTNPSLKLEATLILGDANGDNHLNILDFNEYASCIGQQTAVCIAKADFNDDGEVDRTLPTSKFLDHNLFTDQFAIVDGD